MFPATFALRKATRTRASCAAVHILSSRSLGSVGPPAQVESISYLILMRSSRLPTEDYPLHAPSRLDYASLCCKLPTWRGYSIGDLILFFIRRFLRFSRSATCQHHLSLRDYLWMTA